jgi:hypothetical protein
MDSLSLDTLAEPSERQIVEAGRVSSDVVTVVVALGEPAALDYATFVHSNARRQVVLLGNERALTKLPSSSSARSIKDAAFIHALSLRNGPTRYELTLFVAPDVEDCDLEALEVLLADQPTVWSFIAVVTSFRIHLNDARLTQLETKLRHRLGQHALRFVHLRAGHLLSPHSVISQRLRRYAFLSPLAPKRYRTCFLGGDELFSAIEWERSSSATRTRQTFTLLGPSRPWNELLDLNQQHTFSIIALRFVALALSVTGIGLLLGLIVTALARRRPAWRGWNVEKLEPSSISELLAIYNKYNFRNVKIVGYNNGVVHFGQRFVGRTLVSTVKCCRARRVRADMLKLDSGATVRSARDFLAGTDQELAVIPNYSYVAIGTAFFVPIHGSATKLSTIADSITRVVLYDPKRDRIVVANRDQCAFRESLYKLDQDVLLLRLYLRTVPRSRYFVQKDVVQTPSGAELAAILQEQEPANVEVRKGNATADEVTIYRYFKDQGGQNSNAVEVPRDSLGRLWDRLEENRFTSYLLHTLTRRFAWHVELFFTPAEFATFWRDHGTLPLRKIQLRYIRADGMPQSPFCNHDCISVDLFMFRRHRRQLEGYLNDTGSVIRYNPGKHSG